MKKITISLVLSLLMSPALLHSMNRTPLEQLHENSNQLKRQDEQWRLHNEVFPYPATQLDLANGNFSGADLQGVWIGEANIHNADFSNANLCGARFLENRGMETAKFTGARYNKATELPNTWFNPEDHGMIFVEDENIVEEEKR